MELPENAGKTMATPRERIKIAGRETGDVIWESDQENETADPEEHKRHQIASRSDGESPFARNSVLRKPLRHKSLDALASEMDSKAKKGDGATWPELKRAGKWNSMEQVRSKNEFAGARSKSLPTSRCQSSESLNFETGAGLDELSEKLNALKSSQQELKADQEEGEVNEESEEELTSEENDAKKESGRESKDNDDEVKDEETLSEIHENEEPNIEKLEEKEVQTEMEVEEVLKVKQSEVPPEVPSPCKATNTEAPEVRSSSVQCPSGRETPREDDKKPERKHSKKDRKERKSRTESRRDRDGASSRGSSRKLVDSPRDKAATPVETPRDRRPTSRSSSRGESAISRAPSTRPYSRTSNTGTPSGKTPRSNSVSRKGSKGPADVLSLVAGERPGRDMVTATNYHVEDSAGPMEQFQGDLNRSLVNDIFSPLSETQKNLRLGKNKPSSRVGQERNAHVQNEEHQGDLNRSVVDDIFAPLSQSQMNLRLGKGKPVNNMGRGQDAHAQNEDLNRSLVTDIFAPLSQSQMNLRLAQKGRGEYSDAHALNTSRSLKRSGSIVNRVRVSTLD